MKVFFYVDGESLEPIDMSSVPSVGDMVKIWEREQSTGTLNKEIFLVERREFNYSNRSVSAAPSLGPEIEALVYLVRDTETPDEKEADDE